MKRRRSPNHDLTREAYELTRRRSFGRTALVVAGSLLLVALLAVGVRFFENHLAPATYLSDVRAENVELRKEVTKLRFELEVELATRSELERQLASLNEQLKQASDELAFLKSAGARATGK